MAKVPLSNVERLVFDLGPILSSDLCRRLEDAGLSSSAARQRISRAGGQVKRVSPLPFPKRASVLFHESISDSRAYWDGLLKIAKEASPVYGAAIAAVQARSGVVPLAHFDIISGAPQRQKRQIPSSAVLERLIEARLRPS